MPKARAHQGGGLPLTLLVVGPALIAGWLSPDLTLAGVGLYLTAMFVVLAVHVVVHEAAHALTAIVLGIRVPEVELGDRAPWIRLRIGGVTVRIGGFHSGTTHLEPRTPHLLSLRMALVTGAGPLSNLVIAALAWLLPWADYSFALTALRHMLIGAGVVLAVVNLLPLRMGLVATDGRQLLELLRHDPGMAQRLLAEGRLAAAYRQHRDGDAPTMPDDDEPSEVDRTDPVLLGIDGTRRIFTGDYDEAVEMLRESAARPHDDDHKRLFVFEGGVIGSVLRR